MDALINYVSTAGFGQNPELFERWWPADLHVIGKDITRFHCIIWPAMLMSAGVALPQQVFGHGFVMFKGERMSKSLGTVVDPLDVIEKFGQCGTARTIHAHVERILSTKAEPTPLSIDLH